MYSLKNDLILYFLLVLVALFTIFYDLDSGQAYKHEAVTVREGDTIWQFGKQFAKNDEDVRKVVDRIYRANNLDSETFIRPGQQLIVPVMKSEQETKVALNEILPYNQDLYGKITY